KTYKPIMITTQIYNVCNFITSDLNAALISEINQEVQIEKANFKKQVNNYLTAVAPKKSLKFNQSLDDQQYKGVVFDAIYTTKNSKVTLIEYITGSDVSYFRRSICQSTSNFEIANDSKYREVIQDIIPVINDR